MSNYAPVSTEGLPSLPPAYQDQHAFSRGAPESSNTPILEEFEIDEDEVYEPAKRGLLLLRLQFLSQRIIYTFKDRVVAPLIHLLTPLREACNFFSTRYEQGILKLGNPLVVKRLLYVGTIIAVMYAIPMSGNSEGVNGASGGAFSSGKFYDVEKLGDTIKLLIDAKTLKENTQYLSSMPHMAGSTGDLALARYVESYFSFNGIDVIDFHELDTFVNYPKSDNTYVKLADESFSATLHESSGKQMQHLAFNPNSPASDGEIYAHYIYAGEGTAADLEKLSKEGIDIKDSVLLIKYGGDIPEANKVATAQSKGVKAIVFITPAVDWAGSLHEDVIQKVNVGLTRYSPGDVLTPGWSSHDGHTARLAWLQSTVTAKIPCIPISYRDGLVFIQKLNKKGVQFEENIWSGSNSADNMMKIRVNQEERSTHLIWNVIGSISGREQTDRGIIFGAPRDSVGYGASTSASSTAVLLELVKIFTSLQRRFDWTPARSIYFVSFDASEYNLAGSSEWVESKKRQLQEEGYAYIEVSDIQVGDLLSVTANPLLHELVKAEMRKVEISDKTNSQISLYDLFKKQHGDSDQISNNFLESKDYIPFVNYLNIPSLDIGFRRQEGDIPKRSCIDSFSNFEKELDSLMLHHIAILELLARIGLRLAEEPLIPYNFNSLTESLKRYKEDLERFVADVIKKAGSDVTPQMHYDSLRRGLDHLSDGAGMIEGFRKDWAEFIRSSSSLEPVMLAAARRATNDNMISFNNVFLAQGGIPDRAGYINFLFGLPYDAPDHKDETYEWNTFPMIRDYVMKGEFGKAQFEITRISELLDAASKTIMTL